MEDYGLFQVQFLKAPYNLHDPDSNKCTVEKKIGLLDPLRIKNFPYCAQQAESLQVSLPLVTFLCSGIPNCQPNLSLEMTIEKEMTGISIHLILSASTDLQCF